MLTRYRWYRIQLPHEATDLATLVAKCPFISDASFGFSQVDAGIGDPKHRFLWRTKVVITKLDVEGLPTYEQVESVSFTDFSVVVVDAMTFIRIENPGRNIRDLLNTLESLAGMGFTAKPMTFERARPTTIFNQVSVSKMVGLKVVGAVIDEDLVARMEFASKQGMNVDNMKVLNSLKYKVELAVFEFIYEGIRGQVAFSANGSVKISGQLAPKLVSLIELDLPRLM